MTTKQQLLDFDNLAFHTHPASPKAVMAQLKFGDFMISVVANTEDGHGLYGHVDDNEYEVFNDFQGWNNSSCSMWRCSRRSISCSNQ